MCLESIERCENSFICDEGVDERREMLINLPLTVFPLTPQQGKVNPPIASVISTYI